MELTILQVAQQLGCTKAAIRFHLPKLSADMICKQDNGTILISNSGVEMLKDMMKKENIKSTEPADITTMMIEALTTQLSRKDEQLLRKDKQIDDLTKLLDQQQQLQAVTTPKFIEENEMPKKRKFWHLFSRKD